MACTTETEYMLQVQPMLKAIARDFAGKTGLDGVELLSEMQLYALEAIRSHDWNKGPLEAWVRRLVKQRLYRKAKFPGFREKYGKNGSEPADREDKSFNFGQFLLELSEDAAVAAQLAITEGIEDRSYIQSLLYASYGWTEAKINRVFREIQENLR